MPSTFSTNLKLTLMATGEDNGTWGTITNNNEGTLIEQAIVSKAAVAITDGADTTITIPNGVTSSGRCFVLNLTGVLSAQRNLIVPTLDKPYIVSNGTTGGFGVQVKTSAGTGIVVPPGTRRYLFADSTNVVNMIDSMGNLTVSGAFVALGTIDLSGATFSGPINGAQGGTGVVNTGKTVTLGGNLTTSGAFNTTLTVTADTGVTLPVTGTLATLAGIETLTNKTLTAPVINTGNLGSASVAATQATADNSTKLATTAYADAAAALALPPGVFFPYAGSTAPTGYLLCDGSAVSRATYANLFTAISTTYGVGNGTTTFNIPDMRGRVPAGADAMGGTPANRLGSGATGGITGSATAGAVGGEQSHQLTTSELASHSHSDLQQSNSTPSTGGGNVVGTAGGGSTGSAGGDAAHNNVQPTLVTGYIIKT